MIGIAQGCSSLAWPVVVWLFFFNQRLEPVDSLNSCLISPRPVFKTKCRFKSLCWWGHDLASLWIQPMFTIFSHYQQWQQVTGTERDAFHSLATSLIQHANSFWIETSSPDMMMVFSELIQDKKLESPSLLTKSVLGFAQPSRTVGEQAGEVEGGNPIIQVKSIALMGPATWIPHHGLLMWSLLPVLCNGVQ